MIQGLPVESWGLSNTLVWYVGWPSACSSINWAARSSTSTPHVSDVMTACVVAVASRSRLFASFFSFRLFFSGCLCKAQVRVDFIFYFSRFLLLVFFFGCRENSKLTVYGIQPTLECPSSPFATLHFNLHFFPSNQIKRKKKSTRKRKSEFSAFPATELRSH